MMRLTDQLIIFLATEAKENTESSLPSVTSVHSVAAAIIRR